MQKSKFGISQIATQTPTWARYMFRVVLYLAAAVNIVLQIVDEIPEPVAAIIGKYSLYAVALVHAFSKLWGIEVEGPPQYTQFNKPK